MLHVCCHSFFKEELMNTKTPNPGSEEAIAAGCNCPVIDNHYGRGIPMRNPDDNKIEIAFWMTADCVLHGIKDTAPLIDVVEELQGN